MMPRVVLALLVGLAAGAFLTMATVGGALWGRLSLQLCPVPPAATESSGR